MDTHRTAAFLLAAALVLIGMAGSTGGARAQGLRGAAAYVDWQTAVEPATVAPGEQVDVTLHARIADGWKMYALDSPPPTRSVEVAFEEVPEGFTLRGIEQSTPQEGYDPNFDKTVRYFEEQATLTAGFDVAATVAPGTYTLGGSVTFQICTDRLCLPPTPVPFSVRVEVRGAPAGGEQGSRSASAFSGATTSAAPADTAGGSGALTGAGDPAGTDGMLPRVPGRAAGGGLWGFLLLAAGAGLAALLTPCVFPMIPLTVSYFTRHGEDRREAVRMAVVYGGTIVLTFTGLGVLAALLVGAAGAQTLAANPWVNLFIGVVFVVFALSLLGLFELRLPSSLLNYFNRQSNARAGYAGVFFMGLTLTLVSFSCTAPFVGGLLAATTRGAWSYPVLGMAVFSAVFALPFVGFALFPNRLEALPKSGAWMSTLKVVLGFIELAAAIKFLSNADLVWGTGIITRPLAIAVTVVIFFLAGLYLIGKLPLRHHPAPASVGVGRLLAAVAFFGLALYMLPGLLGAPLGALDAYLPPRSSADAGLLSVSLSPSEGAEEFDWHTDDIDAAFAEARAVNKPVFIDFTGYTCTNCRAMETGVFPQPEVARRLREHFVLLRLYTDDPDTGRRFQRYQFKLTGTTALPTYAIVHPYERTLLRQISGMTEAPRFVEFLDAGTAAFMRQERLAMR